MTLYTNNIRSELSDQLTNRRFVIDKSGVKTIELLGVSFLANSLTIFGEVNDDYVSRELAWYKSQSLFVRDIPGKVPAIWEAVAGKDGEINSNYGYLIWSNDNYNQYRNVLDQLTENPDSRRAIMIYTRPEMQYDYNLNGKSDFICTNTVQYFIRPMDFENVDALHAVVNMRSNDAIFGYRNDYAWQRYVLKELATDLCVKQGTMTWQVGSLHVYERHFYLVDNYHKSGNLHITKEEYHKMYPEMVWGL